MSFDSLLQQARQTPLGYDRREAYYEGDVRLAALGVNLPPATRVLEMVAPFPKMAIDVLVESLTPQGFLLASDSDGVAATLRKWWQANDLDTTCRLAFTEALVQGLAYWIVGDGTDSVPRVTAHSAKGMAAAYDHMGALTEAVRTWRSGGSRYAAHYLPGLTQWRVERGSQWVVIDERDTGLDRPAVIPMVNRARLGDTEGRSEITELMMISDAASRSLTNLQVAQELLSMPLRYVFGKGLTEAVGNDPVKRLKAYYNTLMTGPEGSTAGQLAGADLSPIISSYKLYAQQISAITGIPPTMLGISTDNPASAEALRVAKERLITRAEVKQEMFGDALEEVARLMLGLMGQGKGADLSTLEVQWRDPATPSQSAYTAAMLQAQAQGVISSATARDALRLTPEQQAREDAAAHDQQSMIG
ncbi:phage portal protein [Actinomyces faecalis]|uniref:phage portal protein n=1 Tax=Actinomyces faecalis TaxID=2722820 RepID=UPI001556AA36|nr:phage portal protein [Actinomyces faecalis]